MLTFPPTHALSPVIPNNASHLCLTAAAGTELAVTSSGLDQSTEVLAQEISSLTKAVYNPKAFFPHAAWLDQGCPH